MHRVSIQIRFNDVDIFGHVNNSIYNQYLDLGRLRYLQGVLNEVTSWKGKSLVLVHIENDYFIPTHMYEEIEVQTCVCEIGTKSIKMNQRIVDKQGNIKLESYSVLSTFDVQTNSSFVLPDDWRKKIEDYEK